MDLNTITVQDFKEQFPRDFPYLPVWSITTTYNQGQRVYYEPTALFYDCKNNGVTSLPTDTNDWDVAQDDINNYVLDSDIERAFAEAQMLFNQTLFYDDAEIQLAYLYLTAFFLVEDIKRATQGLNSSSSFNVASRSVGSVSESYDIPDAYKNDPQLSILSSNGYGQKYTMLIYGRSRGMIMTVQGATHA
jgi:hypothetical protein